MLTDTDLNQVLEQGFLRLSMLGPSQIPLWEVSPSVLHQHISREIEQSILPVSDASGSWGCYHLPDIYVRLPDTSLVRPDIAIFCDPIPRQTTAYAAVPAAVIEIISPDYQAKDDLLALTYLANGVRDVLLVNPETGTFTHHRPGQSISTQPLPQRLTLTCGCQVTLSA